MRQRLISKCSWIATKAQYKGPQGLIKAYLMAYNQISFLGWSWILVLAIKELVENDFNYTGVFNAVWKYLPAVQTAAALEVSNPSNRGNVTPII
jgi:hypothetical protein